MLKFLLYLFVFYVVFRFIFGKLLGGAVKTKVYRFETHHHYNEQPKEEGKVTINPGETKKPTGNKNIGEYVDYEEVK